MMLNTRSRYCSVPLALSWKHDGISYRVTAWPDVQFERACGEEWIPAQPAAEALAQARIPTRAWQSYLEFVPADVRELLGLFRANRLAALNVAARCPDIVGSLLETPALLAYVAAHPLLRGESMHRWHVLNAVFERAGVFGILEWLGLPASRQSLAVLRNLAAADLAPSLLLPLRTLLWRPQGLVALAQQSAITERDLTDACALAA